MAHFARLNSENIVTEVVVVDNDLIWNNGSEFEEVGELYLQNLLDTTDRWKQTSYNNKFRNKFASIGDTFDEERNVFISPQPYPSWVLNEQALAWEAPSPYPENDDKYYYEWNEESVAWVAAGEKIILEQPES